MPYLLIGLSLVFLFFGAEGLVRGSSSLALRCGLSPLVVGLTIVAFGTSSPELVVALKGALSGQGDIVIGNVVGSNIFNIAAILGITALICPIAVHLQVIKIDGPIMLLSALALCGLLWDRQISRTEGIVLAASVIVYTVFIIRLARRESTTELPDQEPSPRNSHWAKDALFIVVGIGILILGSRLLVDNAILLARAWNISEAVIGLTIIAAGTSLPELATSVVAALRGQSDMAIGNVVGSNIFNVLCISGVAGVVAPYQVGNISSLDYGFMIGLSIILLPIIWTGLTITRKEGTLFLLCYAAYLALIWP